MYLLFLCNTSLFEDNYAWKSNFRRKLQPKYGILSNCIWSLGFWFNHPKIVKSLNMASYQILSIVNFQCNDSFLFHMSDLKNQSKQRLTTIIRDNVNGWMDRPVWRLLSILAPPPKSWKSISVFFKIPFYCDKV